MSNVTLLVTRPKSEAQSFAELLPPKLAERMNVILSPIIGIEPVPIPEPIDSPGIIFTSRNAVAIASRLFAHRNHVVYCLGCATAKVAAAAGWAVRQTGRNADELVAIIPCIAPGEPLLHLRGRHSRGTVAQRLSDAGIPTREQVVYDQIALPLSHAARSALLDTSVIAPIFSPRSAELLAREAQDAVDLHIVAISRETAKCLKHLHPSTLVSAKRPDSGAILTEVNRLATGLLPS